MTLNSLIELLKTSGVNSKKQVINLLSTTNKNELYELKRDIEQRIAELNINKKGGKKMKYFINGIEVSKESFDKRLKKDVVLENSANNDYDDYDNCLDSEEDLRAVDNFIKEQGMNTRVDIEILTDILNEEKEIIVNDNVYSIE